MIKTAKKEVFNYRLFCDICDIEMVCDHYSPKKGGRYFCPMCGARESTKQHYPIDVPVTVPITLTDAGALVGKNLLQEAADLAFKIMEA
jgi:uncharacterized Zn finger protein (UPF0148 family)